MERNDHSFLSKEKVEEASRIFKALAGPTRIKEGSVNHITEVLEMTKSAVSHQLSFLRNLRLVKFRREGNTFFYTYNDEYVITILNQVLSHIDCD